MRKKTFRFCQCLVSFAMVCLFCLTSMVIAKAAENYPDFTSYTENTDTGYSIYLDDWAELLTETEEQQLAAIMKPISAYGNVAFVSITENPYHNTEDYADKYYYDHFAFDSGTVFLIDMDERMLFLHSNGEIYKTITTDYTYSITSNVYDYASDGDYYTCAATAFEQIHTLLEGRQIAQPMKYISNALLSVVLALLINYFIVMLCSRSKKASDVQILNGIYSKTEIHNPATHFIHQTRRYLPQSSGSAHSGGGGGGSRGGGGRSGGGGGGSRGGGGGHRF